MIVCYAYDLQVTLAALLSDSRHRTKQAAVQFQIVPRCSHPLGSGQSSVYSLERKTATARLLNTVVTELCVLVGSES